MAKVEQNWLADAFDAIVIKGQDGKFIIQGIDGNQVMLKGNFEQKFSHNLRMEPSGRWLPIYISGNNGEFTLQLPKSKIWTIDLFSGRAQFKAENIQSRLHLWCGKGDVQIENCQGAFTVTSGNAIVTLKHFGEIETPEIPPLPREERPIRMDDPESWEDWGEGWAQWGAEFGEKFLRGFFGSGTGQKSGLNIQTGKGDVNLEEINAKSCLIRTGRGDAKLKQGSISNLDMKIMSGDIECESCLPAGNWHLRTNRGDIHLALPADTTARLDLTTRHGDIQSKTPLVRVTRQGPESWHGNRMVGSIGAKSEGKIPEIDASTLSGDIEIKTQSTSSQYYGKPGNETIIITPPISNRTDVYDSPLAVLTALGDGKINVDEAERLLRGLKS
jgi:hypothetical protein